MSVRSYLLDAFYSLGAKINKRGGDITDENIEGIVGPRLPSLDLDMDTSALVDLSDTWERSWNDSDVKQKWVQRGEENEKYWLGEHYDRPAADKTRAVKDNAIFQGLETYLPQVTRRDPEAMVELARSEVNGTSPEEMKAKEAYAHAVQLELAEIADDIVLRLKLKGVARNWSVRLVGVAKFSWDVEKDQPMMKVLRPTKIILDPDAVTDEDGYSGSRIGEYRKLSADKLCDFIQGEKEAEENIKYIQEYVKNEMATEVQFIEWWTPDYFFWKLNSRVLKRKKNPHWNYDEIEGEKPAAPEAPAEGSEGAVEADSTSQEEHDEAPEVPKEGQEPIQAADGTPPMPKIEGEPEPAGPQARAPRKGFNHLRSRQMPYLLLSVYNLGSQPVDQTSLIGQNLSNQDLINKRIRQIDKTADSAIGGMVVSLARAGLTQKQAAGVTRALRKNGVIAIPDGAPQEAIWKPPATELPVYVYTQLTDTRMRVLDIWGLTGTTPQGLLKERTVRGKIQAQTVDTDRIGGGITEALEQYSDRVYNWLYQLIVVYDDRFADALDNGTPIPRLKISVKEGSLLPKDSTTLANQAMTLSGEGKMSTIDLYKALDYPNPDEMAANAWLEVNAPDILFENDERVQRAVQARQQAAAAVEAAKNGGGKKGPSESMNFKDLPPEGKAQMAAQAGIELAPEAVAAHEAMQNMPAAPQLGAPTQ